MPLLILNVLYGIKMTGCSSPRGRDWLGSFCAIPHLNMVTQRQPWYLDLWDAQDSITHDVPLPAPDRNLVIGYHHIYDAELYFSQQLARTALLPDDLETTDLHQGLSELPPAQYNLRFLLYLLPSTDMNLFQNGLSQCHRP